MFQKDLGLPAVAGSCFATIKSLSNRLLISSISWEWQCHWFWGLFAKMRSLVAHAGLNPEPLPCHYVEPPASTSKELGTPCRHLRPHEVYMVRRYRFRSSNWAVSLALQKTPGTQQNTAYKSPQSIANGPWLPRSRWWYMGSVCRGPLPFTAKTMFTLKIHHKLMHCLFF